MIHEAMITKSSSSLMRLKVTVIAILVVVVDIKPTTAAAKC